jgi:hypothetical protein
MALTSKADLIREARKNLGEPDSESSTIKTLLDALEAFYMNGCADEVSGDVEGPTGHFYRVSRWIVTTDSQGFKSVDGWPNVMAAEKAFGDADCEYREWA